METYHPEKQPELLLVICTDCGETGLLSRPAVQKLLAENHGKLEVTCQHCAGRMIAPDAAKNTEEHPRFFSAN